MEGNEDKKPKNKKIINIILLVTLLLFTIIVVPLIIHIAFKFNSTSEFFKAEWSAGEFLAFYGCILSFGGTLFLGSVTVFQNIKQRSDNNEVQRRIIQPYMNREFISYNKRDLQDDMEHSQIQISNKGEIEGVTLSKHLSSEYKKLHELDCELKELSEKCDFESYKDKSNEFKNEQIVHSKRYVFNILKIINMGLGHAVELNVYVDKNPICATKSLISTADINLPLLFDFHQNIENECKNRAFNKKIVIMFSNMLGESFVQEFNLGFEYNKNGEFNMIDDLQEISIPRFISKIEKQQIIK